MDRLLVRSQNKSGQSKAPTLAFLDYGGQSPLPLGLQTVGGFGKILLKQYFEPCLGLSGATAKLRGLVGGPVQTKGIEGAEGRALGSTRPKLIT